MSENDDSSNNRTVFRPSPLQGLNQPQKLPQPRPEASFGPSSGRQMDSGPIFPVPPAALGQPPIAAPTQDDIPLPGQPQLVRNKLMLEAGPILALAASIRSGRAREPLQQFHGQATAAITSFDRAISGRYPEETRQRAKYALCSTLDDIAQNLPGAPHDAAAWARQSMVAQTFHENIGGDRFWQLVEDMLARPAQQGDLIELFHGCLAAGFEGRFRVMADGKRRLHEIMQQLYGTLDHSRGVSSDVLVPHWKGETAPLRRVAFASYIMLAGATATALLLLVYIVLRTMLMQSGVASWDALSKINPPNRLSLSREGASPPATPTGLQVNRLRQFLAEEIKQGLVVVEDDASTVRVRTTVGQLFRSGSNELEAGRDRLFQRIGEALDREEGAITVEGHSDSDRISNNVSFPDNMTLSGARAQTVARIVAGELGDPGRVETKAIGDTQPIASNGTAEGKAQNRRVEIVIPRRD